jgi:hypothetical protein
LNAADFRDVFSIAAGVFGIGSQLTPQGEIGMLVEEPTDDVVDRCACEVLGASAHQPLTSGDAHSNGCGGCRHAISLQIGLHFVYDVPRSDGLGQFGGSS